MDELWDDYLQYLIWRGGLQKFTRYERLFAILNEIDFVYLIDRDDNRSADGVELRDNYKIPDEYYDYADEFFDKPCSVLEMLIALSIRVDNEFIGDPAKEHPEIFFMEMIKNLGLGLFKEKKYSVDNVRRRIDRWLNRRFTSHGLGSPFPVLNDRRDQRGLEIWDQMNAYICEKYG